MTQTISPPDQPGLQRLRPEELAGLLMALSARERVDAILSRTDSAAVVAALPAQDFYFSVMELGPDNALPLLAMAEMPQLNLVFDLQWWRKDQLLPAHALEWIERLAQGGQENLVRWFYEADFVLLATLFKKWLRVAVVPDDADLSEVRDALPPHTLDDQYFWETTYPQYEDLLKSLLGFLFEAHYGFYKELMNHVVWATDTEMEEESLRLRRGRLEDLAIPDFYEALEIYRALEGDEMPLLDRSAVSQAREPEEPAPSFALALLAGNDLFARALRRLQESPWRTAIQLELAALANKVVVADEQIPEDLDSLRQAIDKVDAMVSLGLDLQTAGDEELAAMTLERVFLEHLFRLGHSRVARLRGRLQRLCKSGWLARWQAGIDCLDAPWKEAAALLLAKTPKGLRLNADPQGAHREDLIRSRQDLFMAKQTVNTIAALQRLSEELGSSLEMLGSGLWQGGQVRLMMDVTLGKLLWTAAANRLWGGQWQLQLLPVSVWPEIYPHIAPGLMEPTIVAWLDQRILDEPQRNLTLSYLQPVFRAYREEITAVGLEAITDPRYVTFFLFSGE